VSGRFRLEQAGNPLMRALLRKELRSLAPFIGLVLFFQLLSLAEILLTEFPDQYRFSELMSQSEGNQVMTFAVAFALAAGLLVRERDEGTLAFLDTLPVSRTQIFFSKFALALGVLWLMPLSDLALRAIFFAWSRTSLETFFPWTLLVTGMLLDAASCFIFLAIGLALSFLRRFSLLVFGLVVLSYVLLAECRTPFLPLFNIFTLNEPVFQGQHWLIPTGKLLTQLSVGAVCLAIALGAFLVMGDEVQRFADRLRRRRSVSLLAGLGMALAVAVWVGLFFYWQRNSSEEDDRTVRYAPWTTSRATTSRYQFLYPENQAGLVGQLLDRADAVEARVREFLQAQPISRIAADLTGSSPHTAGVAHWKQVQIDLAAAGPRLASLVAVLGHETTHVYIDHEGQSHIDDDFNATRFFHEGIATYVEYHQFRTTNELPALRRVAAVMHARGEVKYEELLDSETLARNRDTDLVYPLGEVFVTALVHRYGAAAPGQVVRAFGRPGAPKNLKGLFLWQDVLQACGFNLSEVEDSFFVELDRAVAEQRRFIDSLPRLRGAVQRKERSIVVRATHGGVAPRRGDLPVPSAGRHPRLALPVRLRGGEWNHPGGPGRLSRTNFLVSTWVARDWNQPAHL
jgi:ABC-type transport system involved in multi-copper enzyme maturation permease subunit